MGNLTLDDSHKAVVGGKSTVTGNAIPIHSLPVGSVNALVTALVDGSGNQITSANGGLNVNLSTLISGEDQSNNLLRVGGAGAAASAIVGNPVLMGLSDGTNTRYAYTAKAALNNYSLTDGSNVAAMALFAGNKDSGWNRIENINFDADNYTPANFPSLVTTNFNLVSNGTNWERARSMGGLSGAVGLQAVGVAGGLMPNGTALNTYSAHITTNTTTTPTAATAYISCITISIDVIATTAGTLTIKDKSGTPLILVNGLNTTTAVSTTPTILNFERPIKMTGGIDIVTAASVGQATLDVWIDYYQ